MDTELGKNLAQQTVWLMGISFMLGSLFTIFVLIILDMLRAARESRDAVGDMEAIDGDSYEHAGESDA